MGVVVSRLSAPGASPGWENCLVLLGKTLYSPVPLSSQLYKSLWWTKIPLWKGGILLVTLCYKNWIYCTHLTSNVVGHPGSAFLSYFLNLKWLEIFSTSVLCYMPLWNWSQHLVSCCLCILLSAMRCFKCVRAFDSVWVHWSIYPSLPPS